LWDDWSVDGGTEAGYERDSSRHGICCDLLPQLKHQKSVTPSAHDVIEITHRPVLRIQRVFWAIEGHDYGRLGGFFLQNLPWRDVAAGIGYSLESIFLAGN
jgi:hypothetical protein